MNTSGSPTSFSPLISRFICVELRPTINVVQLDSVKSAFLPRLSGRHAPVGDEGDSSAQIKARQSRARQAAAQRGSIVVARHSQPGSRDSHVPPH